MAAVEQRRGRRGAPRQVLQGDPVHHDGLPQPDVHVSRRSVQRQALPCQPRRRQDQLRRTRTCWGRLPAPGTRTMRAGTRRCDRGCQVARCKGLGAERAHLAALAARLPLIASAGAAGRPGAAMRGGGDPAAGRLLCPGRAGAARPASSGEHLAGVRVHKGGARNPGATRCSATAHLRPPLTSSARLLL